MIMKDLHLIMNTGTDLYFKLILALVNVICFYNFQLQIQIFYGHIYHSLGVNKEFVINLLVELFQT